MLAAAFAHRSEGVGRALVDYAEQDSAQRGRRTMQLELLVPVGWNHPSKEFLKGWYGRRGYEVVRTGSMDDLYPHLAVLLACPCDLLIYEKPLKRREARRSGPLERSIRCGAVPAPCRPP